MKLTYEKLFKAANDGHRYFREYRYGEPTGRVAVADNSGATPPDTEDGTLYLDTEAVLEYGLGSHGCVRIPLIAPDGNRTFSTGESVVGGLQVAEAFGMKLIVVIAGVPHRLRLEKEGE